jgi:hypothetical protein
VIGWILFSILIGAVTALAVVLVRFNLKRVHIARCAQQATAQQLERIYAALESIGTQPANGYVLARTNQTSDIQECLIVLPAELAGFPWAGRTVHVEASATPEFRFVPDPAAAPVALGKVLRPLRVPRITLARSGRQQNWFAPARLLKESEALRAALAEVCPRYPLELLAYLLCVGRESFEFDEISQARIGTTAAWVQEPEHPACDRCRKRMMLILQLPGTLLPGKAFTEATFYFFGCGSHPDQTRSVGQYS